MRLWHTRITSTGTSADGGGSLAFESKFPHNVYLVVNIGDDMLIIALRPVILNADVTGSAVQGHVNTHLRNSA